MCLLSPSFYREITITVFNNELKDQFSKVALTWLTSLNNPNIEHTVNGREVKI